MAERKCSVCQQPGHTKRTCTYFEKRAENLAMDAEIVATHPPADAYEVPGSATRVPGTSMTEPGQYPPVVETVTKGPWHGALRGGRCTWCGDPYFEGDRIRSDGMGGWECEKGYEETATPDPAWVKPTAANVQLPPAEPAPDLFSSPAPVSGDVFSGPAAVDGDAPQEGKTERLGYICKDPVLGDFRRYKNGKKKGITRATTFNKAATNSKGITDWNKRNIIVGASRRPDIVAKAHGLDVDQDSAKLMEIADLLEDAAGGNVASAMGTEVHSWTERVDSGEAKLDDVPTQYQQAVRLYVGLLREHGFHIVPELRERTTYVKEFGGVAGTFDAILYHEPSATYRISDTKTGKSMDNGWPEIECQLWLYQHGYNRFGTYNWDTHDWEPPQHRVERDYGVVIHLPVAGPLAGTGRLKRANLEEGRKHADLCGLVRAGGKSKAEDWVNPVIDWEVRFSRVRTNLEAADLWKAAKAAGVDRMELQRLVGLAQDSLRVHS